MTVDNMISRHIFVVVCLFVFCYFDFDFYQRQDVEKCESRSRQANFGCLCWNRFLAPILKSTSFPHAYLSSKVNLQIPSDNE